MKIIISSILLLSTAFLLCSYSVNEFGAEQQLFLDGHHFLSIIMIDDVCAIRAHPGNDINGWGSTLYLQPFLPGAVLGHTVLNNIEASNDGVTMSFTGLVSYGNAGNWGEWNSELFFSYATSQKIVNGSGTYNIELSEQLPSVSGDLNLAKIASNYLHDVPLLDPPYQGDTGDMHHADVNGSGDGFPFTWNPVENPGYFPGYTTDSLCIDVSGQYNNVDTTFENGINLQPAWKPSLKLTIQSSDSAEMVFGAIYDLAHATEFESDNIGITPLILHDTEQTEFSFSIAFQSTTDEPDVSIDNAILEIDKVSIYPNPLKLSGDNARSELTLRFHSEQDSNRKINLDIYNVKGQMIAEALKCNAYNKEFNLSSEYFTVPGVYLIKVKTIENEFVTKLVVIR